MTDVGSWQVVASTPNQLAWQRQAAAHAGRRAQPAAARLGVSLQRTAFNGDQVGYARVGHGCVGGVVA